MLVNHLHEHTSSSSLTGVIAAKATNWHLQAMLRTTEYIVRIQPCQRPASIADSLEASCSNGRLLCSRLASDWRRVTPINNDDAKRGPTLHGQFSLKKWHTMRSSPFISAKKPFSPKISLYSPWPLLDQIRSRFKIPHGQTLTRLISCLAFNDWASRGGHHDRTCMRCSNRVIKSSCHMDLCIASGPEDIRAHLSFKHCDLEYPVMRGLSSPGPLLLLGCCSLHLI